MLLYLQLLLISPVIFLLIKPTDKFKVFKRIITRILIGVAIVLFAAVATNHSNIMDVYGGILFGGTYLILLYTGMLAGRRQVNKKRATIHGYVCEGAYVLITIGIGLFVSKDKFAIDKFFPFGDAKNPPGISLMIYAMGVMGSIYFLTKWLMKLNNRMLHSALNVLDYVGRHTLYIFLYHKILQKVLVYLWRTIDIEDNIWFKSVVFYCVMIGGFILMEMICRFTWKNCVCRAYLYRKGDFEHT